MKKLFFSLIALLSASLAIAQSPLCIAHRGDSGSHLEMSPSALDSAQALGSDGIEFDLRHTKDGKAILTHDSLLGRVTKNRPGKRCPTRTAVRLLSLQTIQDNCLLTNGQEILSLTRALNLLKNYQGLFFVELKDRLSWDSRDILKSYFTGRENQLRVIAFSRKYLDDLKELNDPFWNKISMLRLSATGFKIPTDYNYGLNIFHKQFKDEMTLEKREIGVWTVNSHDLIKSFLEDKINYITTDDPLLCLTLKAL